MSQLPATGRTSRGGITPTLSGNLFLSRLDEQQRRWYVALESQKVGHGGDRLLAQITGMNVETIRRGRRELEGVRLKVVGIGSKGYLRSWEEKALS